MVCYLSTFERLVLAANEPKSEWPRLLEPYLTRRAQQAFHALSAREQDNYDDVVLAIKRRYHLTPEAYRIKFKKEHKKVNETFEEFASNLQDFFLKWVEIPSAVAEPPNRTKVRWTWHFRTKPNRTQRPGSDVRQKKCKRFCKLINLSFCT